MRLSRSSLIALILGVSSIIQLPCSSSFGEPASNTAAIRERFVEHRVLESGRGDVWHLALSTDGRTIAAANNDGTVTFLELQSGKVKSTLPPHHTGCGAVAFSPNGKFIAAGYWDGTFKLWKFPSGEAVATFNDPTLPAGNAGGMHVSIAFFHKSDSLLASSGGCLSVWDYDGNRLPNSARIDEAAEAALSPGDEAITYFSCQGFFEDRNRLNVWNLVGADHGKPFETESKGWIAWDTKYSPDGNLLAAGVGGSHRDGLFEIRSLSSEVRVPRRHPVPQTPGKVYVWDVASRRHVAELRGPADRVTSIAFSGNSQRLAAGCADGTVWLWNPWSKELQQVLDGHKGVVTSVILSPNNEFIAVSSIDGAIKIWRRYNGE